MNTQAALVRLEAGLAKDPRVEKAAGIEGPRELLFTRCMVAWVERLAPSPSDALLLAAWGHVLDRWTLPRDSHPQKYPMTTAGYHKWRKALDVVSADATEKILREEMADDATVARVRELILKKKFPSDPEARVMEDADCLAFLELKFESYLPEWDEAKTVRILVGTLEKMTPEARVLAQSLSYSPQAKDLIGKAVTQLG